MTYRPAASSKLSRGALLLAAALLAPLILTDLQAQAQEPEPAQSLWISEIHYHPQSVGDGTLDFDDREDTEFIEVTNLRSLSANVSDWCFTAGIDYCFPAGTQLEQFEVFVIARDAAAFSDLYGFAPDGEYGGKLSNSGEVLQLTTRFDQPAFQVEWTTNDLWPTTADGMGPSLELISYEGDPDNPANWQASTAINGTPGSLPTIVAAAPPLATQRSYTEIATAGQPIPISVRATGTTSALLIYNIDFGPDQQLPMEYVLSRWRASFPELQAGSLLRFKIQLTGEGGTATSPRADDTIEWWATVAPSEQQSAVPVLDLFFSEDNWAIINNPNQINICPCPGTVAYEGRVWTNVMVRRAGYSSRSAPKANLRLDFPAGDPLIASFLDSPVDEVTLDAGSTDRDLIREQVAWNLMERLGFEPIRTTHVRVERNGSLQGLYSLREEQDADWRSRHNRDRGLIYKVLGPPNPNTQTFGFGGYYEKKEAFDESDDDTVALSACLDNWDTDQIALRTCMLETVDIPSVVNEMAAMLMIRQSDQREFNFFLYRDSAENNLWRIEPDDLDRTLGISGWGDTGSPVVDPTIFYDRCDSTSSQANEMCRGLLNVPEFRTMFNRRVRTVIDTYLADPIVLAEIADTASYISDEWNDDEDKWDRNAPTFDEMVSGLQAWVSDYVQYQRDGGLLGEIPAAQTATPAIDIIELRPDVGDGVSFAILSNPSSDEAIDISGWTLTGIEPIQFGTVILPGQQVAIVTNDEGFRNERPNFDGVRSWAEGALASAATLTRSDGSVAGTAGTAPPAPLVLNEWNAVSSTSTIADGDPTFGSVPGNGGDWFELVVVEQALDVRGWKLVLSDSDGGPLAIRDTFEFADNPALAALEAGTIMTVTESLPDDITVDQVDGDWHINLQANSADEGAFFTPESQSNFSTNANDWRLVILDATGTVMFGPAGEGIGTVTGIDAAEVGELQVDPSATIDVVSDFGDSDSSTFGLPNISNGDTQDLTALRYAYQRGDVNCDQIINIVDAYVVAKLVVGLIDGEFKCPLSSEQAGYEPAGDLSLDGDLRINDAYLIARCAVGLEGACPD